MFQEERCCRYQKVGSTSVQQGKESQHFYILLNQFFVENQEAVGSSTVNSAFYTRKKEKAKIKKHSELSKHALLLSQTTLVGAKDLQYTSDRCAFQHRADCMFSSCWFPSDLIFRFVGIHQQLKMKAFQKLNFSSHHTIAHVQQNRKSIWGRHTSALWIISLSFYISETQRENILKYGLWKRKQNKGLYTICYICWEGTVCSRKGLFWTLYSCEQSGSAQSKEKIPHAQIPLITKALHRPQVGFRI